MTANAVQTCIPKFWQMKAQYIFLAVGVLSDLMVICFLAPNDIEDISPLFHPQTGIGFPYTYTYTMMYRISHLLYP